MVYGRWCIIRVGYRCSAWLVFWCGVGDFSQIDLVAISVYVISMDSEAMLSFRLLLGFLCVFELKNIYIQSLLMLAHVAEDDGSGFIQIWLCATFSEEWDILGGVNAHYLLAAFRGLYMAGNICYFSRSSGSFPSIYLALIR